MRVCLRGRDVFLMESSMQSPAPAGFFFESKQEDQRVVDVQ